MTRDRRANPLEDAGATQPAVDFDVQGRGGTTRLEIGLGARAIARAPLRIKRALTAPGDH